MTQQMVTKQTRTRRVRRTVADEQGKLRTVEQEITIDPQRAEGQTFADVMARKFASRVDFYINECQEAPEAARVKSVSFAESDREAVADTPPEKLSWRHLASLASLDMDASLKLWESIKQSAREHVEAGMHIGEGVFTEATPLEWARFIALREEMTEGWQPQNGIENTLIDMLTLSYTLFLYWTAVAHGRVTKTAEEMNVGRNQKPEWRGGAWKLPTIYESEAVDQAHRFADGYHRQFMRTLRQLRDLRRYVPPVIVNNGGQVNVGAQQVNVALPD